MFNGMLQTLNSALVPGSHNADNISAELQAFPHLFYPSRPIQQVRLECGMLTSFGFGQVGGQAIIIHPRYIFATLDTQDLQVYTEKRRQRELRSYSRMSSSLMHNDLVQIKDAPPYSAELEKAVLLNPLARAEPSNNSYAFRDNLPSPVTLNNGNTATLKALFAQSRGISGLG
jgi:fatty acid synthase subunit alpha